MHTTPLVPVPAALLQELREATSNKTQHDNIDRLLCPQVSSLSEDENVNGWQCLVDDEITVNENVLPGPHAGVVISRNSDTVQVVLPKYGIVCEPLPEGVRVALVLPQVWDKDGTMIAEKAGA